MTTDATKYTRLVFWLKLTLGFSAGFLFLVILVFSYSKKVEPSFKVVTKDVRIGLKYQARIPTLQETPQMAELLIFMPKL